MSSGNIELTYRPLRIACDIKPTSYSEVKNAIEINSYMWGGAYNPLIPNITRIPKCWIENPPNLKTASQIRIGYIDSFDPDIILTSQGKTPRYEGKVSRGNIPIDEFWEYTDQEHAPSIGIGIYEITEHIYHSEMKFVHRDPITFIFPNYENQYALFFGAVFGRLPENHYNHFLSYFGEALNVKQQDCDLNNFYNLLNPRNQFLRRISQYGIKNRQSGKNIDIVYLLDATNPSDIFDYWNLRALGWNIIPIPFQTMKDSGIIHFATDFLKGSYYSYKYNAQVFHNATVQKSRSIDKSILCEFAGILSEYIPNEKGHYPKYIFRDWFPRIWDQRNVSPDEKKCGFVEYRRDKINLLKTPEKIAFDIPRLDFIKEYSGFGGPLFAINIDYRLYSTNSLFAEVIPEVNRELARYLGANEVEEWRFSKSGLVHLCRHANRRAELSLPLAQDVFKHWLLGKGWRVELSVPGKVGHQILKHLGGIWGTNLLLDINTIKMLSEMCEDRHKTSSEVRSVAEKRASEQIFGKRKPEEIISKLINSNVLLLGIEIQCTVCEQRSWFSLKDFDYKLRCPKCLSEFSPPLSKPTEMNWAYKAIGPFNLPKQSFGLYSVLLTFRFLSMTFDLYTTSMLCFNAKKGNLNIEVDLAFLFKSHRCVDNDAEPSLLFAECKTFNSFTETDIARLNTITDNFPGAYIVLATLRDTLSATEIQTIKRFALKCRKVNTECKPKNPLIILTGEQLFDTWWPPHKWEKKDAPFSTIYSKYSRNGFEELFDATQQLFLGLEPWQDILNRHFHKNHQKKQQLFDSKRKRIPDETTRTGGDECRNTSNNSV